MKIYLSIFASLFIISNLIAQVGDGVDQQINLNDLGREGNTGTVRTFDNRYQGVKGTPMFVDKWITGNVYLENGKIYKEIPLKYDVYQNEVLTFTRGQAIYITREKINNFVLEPDSLDSQIKFTKIEPANQMKKIDKHQFFQVLHESDFTLLELKTKRFFKANYTGAYSANQPYDEFESISKYYYLDEDNKLHQLKTGIGRLSKTFGKRKKEVKDYIYDNDLDPKNTAHLVQIFKYANNLN